ncbi:MAG: MATE family efflux transporter [Balneolaceae bacterium]|nr:MATE family efflux transporter [Balneolaceae bacterium]
MNRRVLRLAIPNIISNLSVPLLGAVDTALVGHLDEVYYLGAIAVGGMIFNIILWGFGFLRMGTTGLTAQAFGENDRTESMMILARAGGVALLLGVLVLLLQGWIADLSFWVVEASPEVERFTRIYFFIRIYSAPATLLLYAVNGWFLGMQNARYPMVITVFLNLLNIILDVLFIYGLNMHVDGVAWGTLIARYAGLLLGLWLLFYKYRSWFSEYLADRLLEFDAIKKFFTVNRDIFIRTLCLIFTFSFFTAKSAEFGDVILAANSILLQLWMIVSYGVDGFAFAAESLVGRYKGAREPDNVAEAVRYCFFWGMGIGAAASLLYWLFDESILWIFTDQRAVIGTAMTVFLWTVAGPVVSSICYIWDGVFIGATETGPMRDSMVMATLLVFLPAFYLAEQALGNHAIWLAMVLFMVTRGVALSFYAPKYIFNR